MAGLSDYINRAGPMQGSQDEGFEEHMGQLEDPTSSARQGIISTTTPAYTSRKTKIVGRDRDGHPIYHTFVTQHPATTANTPYDGFPDFNRENETTAFYGNKRVSEADFMDDLEFSDFKFDNVMNNQKQLQVYGWDVLQAPPETITKTNPQLYSNVPAQTLSWEWSF